jgi:hypothetical protein
MERYGKAEGIGRASGCKRQSMPFENFQNVENCIDMFGEL